MLTVLSPAKALDMDPVGHTPTEPIFREEANRLARTARNLPLEELKSLMHLSDGLATLNRDRYRDFLDAPTEDVVKPAVFAFNGDTYQGLEAKTLSEDALRYAQAHLRILSGLYGLLRPLDAIQAHRLEMGSRLKTRRGKNLYDYWGDEIATALTRQAEEQGTDTLVNCASVEYFTAANRSALGLRVVTPMFLENKGGKTKIVSFYAKRARGSMARFIMENRIEAPQDLRAFDYGGYRHDPERSDDDKPAFVRDWPEG
ncbi:peroxide stress protein YaaA [Salibaculum sp.]|uniref:peroxide stress protein YaaA n=1 Tax=Salibaculum sp. TaxID=2855480 RepID=UPI002B4921A9|nr:peroxide stress protein YaaA [Salibaculum sp.]HKL68072.1 peroxide stress protein YaaA [Salibaculum sp.]